MDFQILERHLKKYPHFDQRIGEEELLAIVTDPERVATNAFLPFIQYTKKYQPFRDKIEKPKKKERLIRYASRRDSVIFAYYRHVLSFQYEERLASLGIQGVPTAYRKIPLDGPSSAGKCNIDFANDLFTEIRTHKQCTVITLDIRKYFESIDHKRLYNVWCDLLGVGRLSSDHLAVFKAITRYSFVERTAAYERLGFIGEKIRPDGSASHGYLRSFKKMPKQLCTPLEFRRKIAGADVEYDSLINRNMNSHGIPQGAPMSDLLANAYLLEFDVAVADFAKALGGQYWRYSDDIVLVLPGGGEVGTNAETYVSNLVQTFGDELHIKSSKTAIGRFTASGNSKFSYERLSGAKGRDGIEYLGFRFDGNMVYLRNSTLSNFYRKITRRARKQAQKHVARYDGKDEDWLLNKFDFQAFEKKFGRVRDFESVSKKKSWTFWTYASRASDRFGKCGQTILKQVKGYRDYIRRAVQDEIRCQLAGRE